MGIHKKEIGSLCCIGIMVFGANLLAVGGLEQVKMASDEAGIPGVQRGQSKGG